MSTNALVHRSLQEHAFNRAVTWVPRPGITICHVLYFILKNENPQPWVTTFASQSCTRRRNFNLSTPWLYAHPSVWYAKAVAKFHSIFNILRASDARQQSRLSFLEGCWSQIGILASPLRSPKVASSSWTLSWDILRKVFRICIQDSAANFWKARQYTVVLVVWNAFPGAPTCSLWTQASASNRDEKQDTAP
jgi:hypothetical protein